MALIPQQISQQPAPRGRSQALRSFDSPVAEGVLAVGDAVGRAERQRDQSAVIAATATLRSEFATRYADAATKAAPDGQGFQAGLQTQLDQYAAGIAEALPSDDARELWARQVQGFEAELQGRANAFEIAQAGDHRARQIGAAIDTTANVVRSDPAQYEAARAEVLAMLDGFEGTVPAEALAELRRAGEQTLAVQALRGGIDEDPGAVLAALDSGDYDGRLTPDQKNTLLGQAEAARDRLALAAEAAEEPTEAFKESSGRLANVMLIGINQGRLTAEDIIAADQDLTRQDQRVLINALGDTATPATDPFTFADLHGRALAGEDITAAARQEFLSGALSKDDYVQLTGVVLNREGPAPIYSRTQEALSNRLGPSPFDQRYDREGAEIRRANALREFDDWVRINPNANEDMYWQQVERIGARWSLGGTAEERRATLPLPMFFQGNRSQPDLDGTQLRIFQHFDSVHAGNRFAMERDPEFIRQAEILAQWRDFMAAQQ